MTILCVRRFFLSWADRSTVNNTTQQDVLTLWNLLIWMTQYEPLQYYFVCVCVCLTVDSIVIVALILSLPPPPLSQVYGRVLVPGSWWLVHWQPCSGSSTTQSRCSSACHAHLLPRCPRVLSESLRPRRLQPASERELVSTSTSSLGGNSPHCYLS